MTKEFVEQRLDKIVLFQIAVTLFSAFRRASTEGIKKAKGVDIHPDEVLTLGSQRVFDKEQLNIFNRLKARMERTCLKYGTPFLKDFGVPEEVANDCAAELDEIVKEANAQKAVLVANYDDLLKDFCAKNPSWASEIRARAFDKAYIEDRIKFNYYPIKLSLAREEGAMADILSNEVHGMMGTLLAGIAEAAGDLQTESLSGKKSVTRKALRPLKAMREKLQGFTFLEPSVQSLIDIIDETLAALPDEGPIEGTYLTMLWGLTGILADPGKAMKVAETYEADGAAAFLAMIRPQAEVQLAAKPATQVPLTLPAEPPVPSGPAVRPPPVGVGALAPQPRPGMPIRPQPVLPAIPRQSFAGLLGAAR